MSLETFKALSAALIIVGNSHLAVAFV